MLTACRVGKCIGPQDYESQNVLGFPKNNPSYIQSIPGETNFNKSSFVDGFVDSILHCAARV